MEGRADTSLPMAAGAIEPKKSMTLFRGSIMRSKTPTN